jgi:hypothetical protein
MLESNGIRIIHVSRAFIESMVAHSLYGAPALRGATSGYDYALRGLGRAVSPSHTADKHALPTVITWQQILEQAGPIHQLRSSSYVLHHPLSAPSEEIHVTPPKYCRTM